jgi:thiol-disulfide isomerase/thioredoxin
MNTNIIVAVAAVLVIIGGVAYYNYGYPAGEVMMEKGGAMMDEGDKMMNKGDALMKEGDDMMKEGEDMMKADGAMMEKAPDGAMMSAGQYIPYSGDKVALAETGDVVLFFRASWCPTCRALDTDIKSHLKDIPKGVTILDVNYDDSTALKQKYGVTRQHTLVQVDAQGDLVAKWSGSPTLAETVTNIK